MQGFQIVHSLGGGTGSGMGTLLIQKLREEFPDKMICTFSVIPSPNVIFDLLTYLLKVSDQLMEPYNAGLALRYLTEDADQVFCVDNEALYDICFRHLRIITPTLDNLNHIAACAMSGATSSLRFASGINKNLRQMAHNLVPLPIMQFLSLSYAPMCKVKRGKVIDVPVTVPGSTMFEILYILELGHQVLLDPRNSLTSVDIYEGKYLSAFTVFRGNAERTKVDEYMSAIRNRNHSFFTNSIPNNSTQFVCSFPQVVNTRY